MWYNHIDLIIMLLVHFFKMCKVVIAEFFIELGFFYTLFPLLDMMFHIEMLFAK